MFSLLFLVIIISVSSVNTVSPKCGFELAIDFFIALYIVKPVSFNISSINKLKSLIIILIALCLK